MLFYDPNNNVLSLSLGDVRQAYPNISFSDELTSLPDGVDFTLYTASEAPDPAWNQKVVESPPVDGVQTWELQTLTGADLTDALASLRVARCAAVDAEYLQIMQSGFPWNFGTDTAPINETLQVATSDDKTNWLTLMFGCQAAIAAGEGAAPVNPPIRCTSNNQYTPTINQTAAILQAMQAWGGAVLLASWTLKNQINDPANDGDAVLAIDVTQGWPA